MLFYCCSVQWFSVGIILLLLFQVHPYLHCIIHVHYRCIIHVHYHCIIHVHYHCIIHVHYHCSIHSHYHCIIHVHCVSRFIGTYNKTEASQKLVDQDDGVFLVRESKDRPGSYALGIA